MTNEQILRDAAQQAIDAIKKSFDYWPLPEVVDDACIALQAALAQPATAQAEQMKPVAYVNLRMLQSGNYWPDDCFCDTQREGDVPLYATPQPQPAQRDSKDAARWRWTRSNDSAKADCPQIQEMWRKCVGNYPSEDEWDAAIDAAIAAQGEKPVECSVNFKLERRNFESWHKKHRYADRENAWQVWQARAEITAKPPAGLRAELDDMRKERDHWKANHGNMVEKCAFLSQRPDLPVDRIPAYKELSAELSAMTAERNRFKRAIHAANGCLSDLTAERDSLAAEIDALRTAWVELNFPDITKITDVAIKAQGDKP